jgi:hypothetical protein
VHHVDVHADLVPRQPVAYPDTTARCGVGESAPPNDVHSREAGLVSSSHGGLGPGIEGGVAGASVLLTLYGVAILFGSSVLSEEWVPHSRGLTGAILTVLIVVGAVLGAGVASRARR